MSIHAEKQQAQRDHQDKLLMQSIREAAKLLDREQQLNEAEHIRLNELQQRFEMLDGYTTLRAMVRVWRSGLTVF